MQFKEIGAGTRLPFAYLEFDSYQASASLQGVQPYRTLLIGAGAHGVTEINKPVPLMSDQDARAHFGDGSMLHQMATSYFKNSSVEVWGLSIGEAEIQALPKESVAALKGMQFHVVASGFSGPDWLSSLTDELKDRAKANRSMEGFAVSGVKGTITTALDTVKVINSPYLGVMATSGSPSLPHEFAAALSGQVATSAQEDPARPFRTLELLGLVAPGASDTEGGDDRERALHNGLSTYTVDPDNKIRIQRLITTYRKNEVGADDVSYLSPSTLFTLSFLRWDFKRYFNLKYPRHKLASNQFRGQGPVMTPNLAKAECVCLFRKWESAGLVQDIEAFKDGLYCEIDPRDPTRLNIALSPRLVSELSIIGAKLSFLF